MSKIIKKMLTILLPLNGIFGAYMPYTKDYTYSNQKYIRFKNKNILFFKKNIASSQDYMFCWQTYILFSLSNMFLSQGSITCVLKCIIFWLTNILFNKKNILILKSNIHCSSIWVNTFCGDYSLEGFKKY